MKNKANKYNYSSFIEKKKAIKNELTELEDLFKFKDVMASASFISENAQVQNRFLTWAIGKGMGFVTNRFSKSKRKEIDYCPDIQEESHKKNKWLALGSVVLVPIALKFIKQKIRKRP